MFIVCFYCSTNGLIVCALFEQLIKIFDSFWFFKTKLRKITFKFDKIYDEVFSGMWSFRPKTKLSLKTWHFDTQFTDYVSDGFYRNIFKLKLLKELCVKYSCFASSYMFKNNLISWFSIWLTLTCNFKIIDDNFIKCNMNMNWNGKKKEKY